MIKLKKQLLIVICILYLLTACIPFQISDILNRESKREDTARYTLDMYLELWQDGKYEDMYSLLSTSSREKIDKEQFIERYNNIFSAIGLLDMDIDILDDTDEAEGEEKSNKLEEDLDPSREQFLVSITFNTNTVPSFKQNYTIKLVQQEDTWKIDWSPSLIFPDMDYGDVVNIEKFQKTRGQILDRNNEVLANTTNVYTVGAVPKAIPDKNTFAKKLAPIIEVSEEYILKQLDQDWVTDDSFVPLRSYPLSITKEFKDELLGVKGVMLSSQHELARQYTKGAQLAHVTGYVQNIDKDLLEKLADKGYTQEDVIGKQGIEAAMEDTLREQNGYKITIEDENGNEKTAVAETEGKDGNDIILSIDAQLQNICYRAMSDHKGTIVAMNPKTGETLAMVSMPSFDPNMFSFGISQKDWDEIKDDKDHPLINRAANAYIPGSTFKPFTAAMGLDAGVITPETVVKEAENKEWYPSSDWDNAPIRRVEHPAGDVNLRNALVWSDNIYFAWTALKLGSNKIEEYAAKYGIGENIPFELPVDKSQIKKESTNWNERLVADTGYGQGEVLIPPIQLASMYTAFFNDGSILVPQMVREIRASSGESIENFQTKIWKENVIKKDIADTIYSYLIDVVEDNTGTANALQMPNLKIGAKTGTAQLDTDGKEELAWLVTFTDEQENPLLLTICLEVPANEGSDKFDIAKTILKEYYGQ